MTLSAKKSLDSDAGLPDDIYFKPKSRFWVNFAGPRNGKVWYILWLFEKYVGNYDHLVI
jgi:hypothetical protein